MKLIYFAVILLWRVQAGWNGPVQTSYTIEEDYEFWTLDCQRRPAKPTDAYGSISYAAILDPTAVSNYGDVVYGSYKACGTSRCNIVEEHETCKGICNKGLNQDRHYGDLNSCPSGYGFIGYCKDKRGVDEFIRICKKDYLYPNNGAPLITRSGTCTGEDTCTGRSQYGDGDCDSNSDCAAGLSCGDNNCRSMHESGKGQGCFEWDDDCCTGTKPIAWSSKEEVKKACKCKGAGASGRYQRTVVRGGICRDWYSSGWLWCYLKGGLAAAKCPGAVFDASSAEFWSKEPCFQGNRLNRGPPSLEMIHFETEI